jgi:hypothetical protein
VNVYGAGAGSGCDEQGGCGADCDGGANHVGVSLVFRPMGSCGFAQRMMGGMAAAHRAWLVAFQSLVATQTGSAAAMRARA